MIVAVRTPPYNSWKDPAERVMSILNLGAQAVGLMRENTDIENLLGNCSGLKALRKLHDENLGLDVKSKILQSVEPCKSLLQNVFRRLTYSSIPLETYQPASEDEIEGLWGEMQKIDNSLLRTDTQRIKIANKLDFQDFCINTAGIDIILLVLRNVELLTANTSSTRSRRIRNTASYSGSCPQQ